MSSIMHLLKYKPSYICCYIAHVFVMDLSLFVAPVMRTFSENVKVFGRILKDLVTGVFCIKIPYYVSIKTYIALSSFKYVLKVMLLYFEDPVQS
jgi:hypothetical protein